MDTDDYKYDIAFSFLAEDESIATELNDLLQDRLNTFIYSKKQEELAGTDGEEKFNIVFSKQARMVVVLYRDGWGETPWTRIEETAIRNRAFDEGYEFVTFVPLEEKVTTPRWLPKNQIWVGLKRWGSTGAASVIEARVQELGGSPSEESVGDRAKRLERSLQFKEKREKFYSSHEGVQISNSEFEKLGNELEILLDTIKTSTENINYSLKRANRQMVILGPHGGLSINWMYHYANSLTDSKLDVILYQGHPPFPGVTHWEEPRQKGSLKFKIDLLTPDMPGWKLSYPAKREFTTEALAEYIIKYYMEHAEPKD